MRLKDLACGFLVIDLALLSANAAAATNIDIDQLNQQTQNPVAALVSVPFQNNWGFKVGPNHATDYLLNVQPVIPFAITSTLNLITRTVLPITNQPYLGPGVGSAFGLGDTVFTPFLSPNNASRFIWGVGPAFLFPTATNAVLGSEKWGVGPSVVGLTQQGPWTVGVLSNQIWSFAGNPNREDYSSMLIQPFVAYEFAHGWSLSFTSESTCDWKASGPNQWTVPLDFVAAKITVLGHQPLSIGGGVRYFPIKPQGQAVWGARVTVSFLFPK